MAYDEQLAERIRRVLAETPFSERKMFGGLCFMVLEHMCCGIVGDELMLRVGTEAFAEALHRPHARPMDFTGRPMVGMLYVAPAGFKTEKALKAWIDRGVAFVRTLPARPRKMRPPPRPRGTAPKR